MRAESALDRDISIALLFLSTHLADLRTRYKPDRAYVRFRCIGRVCVWCKSDVLRTSVPTILRFFCLVFVWSLVGIGWIFFWISFLFVYLHRGRKTDADEKVKRPIMQRASYQTAHFLEDAAKIKERAALTGALLDRENPGGELCFDF